jgi:hypothetical protein
MQLAVGQAGVVVDDTDDLDLARPAAAVALAAVTVRPVAGPVELRQLEGIDVQQRAGLGPLIAPGRLPRLAAPLPAHAVALEHLPARRAVPAGQPRQAHRPPIGLLARAEDRLLVFVAERPRARLRDRSTRRTPRAAGPLDITGLKPPLPGRGHRRRRASHRAGDRARLLAGEKARHHLTLRARSEPTSTVHHVRPSFGAFSRGDRKPPSEAGRPLSRSAGP